METKIPNENEELVYKTMPRGKDSGIFNFRKSKTETVRPAPVAKPVTAAPAAVPTAAAMPAPQQPVSAAEALMASPAEPRKSFTFGKKKLIISLSAAVLVLGGSAIAYFAFFKSTPPPADLDLLGPEDTVQVSKISDEWRETYFSTKACTDLENCGDDADPDKDGLKNIEEFNALTDPNNFDSDQDGISDGDELHIFGYDPKLASSSGKPEFPDSTNAKTKWNVKEKRAYTTEELTAIGQNIATFGLHAPTIDTLGQALVDEYTNYGKTAQAAELTGQQSTSDNDQIGALDRDTQRADAIKQIGFALLKYKQSNLKYPVTSDFEQMITAIKPLLTGKAVNTSDPKNVTPYVYTYQSISNGADFKLSYYSETQSQAIVLTQKEITTLSTKDQASQRDTQRKADLEQISSALELYSMDNADPNNPESMVFPLQTSWKTNLVPDFISSIPLDPQSKKDYVYTVSTNRDSYALQAALESPPSGKKGYLCTQDGCIYY